jgi:hypothetical protein
MNWPEASSSYTLSATGVQHDKEKTLVAYVEFVVVVVFVCAWSVAVHVYADFCYEV